MSPVRRPSSSHFTPQQTKQSEHETSFPQTTVTRRRIYTESQQRKENTESVSTYTRSPSNHVARVEDGSATRSRQSIGPNNGGRESDQELSRHHKLGPGAEGKGVTGGGEELTMSWKTGIRGASSPYVSGAGEEVKVTFIQLSTKVGRPSGC